MHFARLFVTLALSKLPDIRPAFWWQVQQVVAIDVVEGVPQVGIHDHTVDSEAGMRVDVGLDEDIPLRLTILDAPDVGVGLVELAQLVVAGLAGEALAVEEFLIGVECREESAQVGNVLCLGAVAVTKYQWLTPGVELEVVVAVDD